MSLIVTSPSFKPDGAIPRRHTGDGEDVSPPLAWSGVPEETAELALLVDDPDAPTAEPWCHWILLRIPPGSRGLPEGFHGENVPAGYAALTQGRNSWGTLGYRGPAPPRGHGVHHYHFTLYALKAPIELPPGSDRAAVLRAMAGNTLDRGELVGTYQR